MLYPAELRDHVFQFTGHASCRIREFSPSKNGQPQKTRDFLRGFWFWLHVWLHTVRNRLTVAKIRTLEPQTRRYKVTDGLGLALEVRPSGRMGWRWRYRLAGRPAEINLGRYPQMCLADARKRRDALLMGILDGKAPA